MRPKTESSVSVTGDWSGTQRVKNLKHVIKNYTWSSHPKQWDVADVRLGTTILDTVYNESKKKSIKYKKIEIFHNVKKP